MISRLTDFIWPQTQIAAPQVSQQKTDKKIGEILARFPLVKGLSERFQMDLPIYFKDKPEDVKMRRIFEDRAYPFCRECAQEEDLLALSAEELASSVDQDYQKYIEKISQTLSMEPREVSQMMIHQPEQFWDLIFSKGDFAELLYNEAMAGSLSFFQWLKNTGKLKQIPIDQIERALIFAAERDHWAVCEILANSWMASSRILISGDQPELARAFLAGALQRSEPLDFLTPARYLDITPICLVLLRANHLKNLDFFLEEASVKDIRILLEKARKLNLREGFAKVLEFASEIELDALILETAVAEDTYWRTGMDMPNVQLSRASDPEQQWVIDALRKEADSRGLRLQPTYAKGCSFEAFSSPFESNPAWIARGKWWENALVRLSQNPAALKILGWDSRPIVRPEEIASYLDGLDTGQQVLKQMLQEAKIASEIFKKEYEAGRFEFFFWLKENGALDLLSDEDLKSALLWSSKQRVLSSFNFLAGALSERNPEKWNGFIGDLTADFVFTGRLYVGNKNDFAKLLFCFPGITCELAEPYYSKRFADLKEVIDQMVFMLINESRLKYLDFWFENLGKVLDFRPENLFAKQLKEQVAARIQDLKIEKA